VKHFTDYLIDNNGIGGCHVLCCCGLA
jgi:hypothetical protein